MKAFLLLLFIFLFKVSPCQLVALEAYKHLHTTDKGSVFKQFNFRVVADEGRQVIKALKSDAILYDPKQPVFYEVFNNQFLIVTLIDTVATNNDSTAADLLPRRTMYFIPMNNLKKLKKVYASDLDGTIILQNSKIRKTTVDNWHRMSRVEMDTRKVLLYNSKEMAHQFWFREILL